MARKSRPQLVCPGCKRPLRAGDLVRWIRWCDQIGPDLCCMRCQKFEGSELYDEDGHLVAYSFTARLDGDYPYEIPLGADPREW